MALVCGGLVTRRCPLMNDEMYRPLSADYVGTASVRS